MAGVCLQGGAKDCGDGDPCTVDSCTDGACQHVDADALPCDDGDPCTLDDQCKTGICSAGPAVVCTAGGPCLVAECVFGTGQCAQKPAPTGQNCDDADACTSSDVCAQGACAGAGVPCDDDNPCTDDSCDALHGCQHVATAGPCDDSNPCTGADVCASGGCAGTTLNCGDANPCTDDACDLSVGCTQTAHVGACDDSDTCTKADACTTAGQCEGTPVACDDGDPCTKDSCSAKFGCLHQGGAATAGWSCDDGNPCTGSDACAAGGCAGVPVVCTSDTPCQVAACAAATGDCMWTPVANAKCELDDDSCTLDSCVAGKCKAGPAKNCASGNQCIVGQCEKAAGQCVFTLQNGAPCSDGDACTGPDVCTAGNCFATKSKECDNGNPCTADACDPQTGKCSHIALAQGHACKKVPCLLGETCVAGVCQGGQPNACDDGDNCTIDSCVTISGKCLHVIDAEAPACCNQTAWEEGFEKPLKGWKFGPPIQGLVWHRHGFAGPGWATAGATGLRLGSSAAGTFSGLGTGGGLVWAESPPISLPAGKPATLRMTVAFDVAGGVSSRHRLYVWAVADGREHLLGRPCQQGGTCHAFVRDIGALAGLTFTLHLGGTILGHDAQPASGVGIVIDGMKITTSCKPASCDQDTDCADVGCLVGSCEAETCSQTNTCCTQSADCATGPCEAAECDAGRCRTSTKASCCTDGGQCDDGNPCTLDACPVAGGACSHKAVTGCCLSDAECDDGIGCTKESCKSNKCTSIAHCCQIGADCDDGDPCTTDSCPMGICSHGPNFGQGCCQPVVAHWTLDTPAQANDFMLRTCDPGGTPGALQGCGSSSMVPGRGWQVWAKPPAEVAKSGVLYYGDPKTGNFDYGASAGAARTPPMKVPIGGYINLSFRTLWQHEAAFARDRAHVWLYVDGKRQTVPANTSPRFGALWHAGMPGFAQPGLWQTVTHNVTHLKGHTIQLEFTFDSVDGQDNGGLGWMVDDIKLVSACPEP